MIKVVHNRFSELLAIKERKEGRSYSRREIVEATGISLTSVQNWALNRVTQFQSEQILAFCNFFECDIQDLLVIDEMALSEGELPGQLVGALAG